MCVAIAAFAFVRRERRARVTAVHESYNEADRLFLVAVARLRSQSKRSGTTK